MTFLRSGQLLSDGEKTDNPIYGRGLPRTNAGSDRLLARGLRPVATDRRRWILGVKVHQRARRRKKSYKRPVESPVQPTTLQRRGLDVRLLVPAREDERERDERGKESERGSNLDARRSKSSAHARGYRGTPTMMSFDRGSRYLAVLRLGNDVICRR